MDENENEQAATSAELVEMLHNKDLLAREGLRITPKGYMGLVLMENGASRELATLLAEEMSNRIFLAGYTYLDEQQLGLGAVDDA